jgi:hypothetical protein
MDTDYAQHHGQLTAYQKKRPVRKTGALLSTAVLSVIFVSLSATKESSSGFTICS